MRKSFPTAETLLGHSYSSRKTCRRGTIVPVHRSISHGCEWRPHPRETQQAKACLLRKQNFARCRDTLSDDGKAGACGRNVWTKAEAVFPVPYNRSAHIIPSSNDRAYSRSFWKVAKWAIELSEYDIEYWAKACAKSQILADFLVELPAGCTTNQEPD